MAQRDCFKKFQNFILESVFIHVYLSIEHSIRFYLYSSCQHFHFLIISWKIIACFIKYIYKINITLKIDSFIYIWTLQNFIFWAIKLQREEERQLLRKGKSNQNVIWYLCTCISSGVYKFKFLFDLSFLIDPWDNDNKIKEN